MNETVKTMCRLCSGEGVVDLDEAAGRKKCPHCGGDGWEPVPLGVALDKAFSGRGETVDATALNPVTNAGSNPAAQTNQQ